MRRLNRLKLLTGTVCIVFRRSGGYGSGVLHTGVRPHSERGRTCRRICLVLGVALVTALSPALSAQRPPVVAAASDLNVALTDIARQFERDTGQRVETVFGSSGTLTRQIQDGAPFELFLSADEAFVDTLAGAGLTRGRGVLYGLGRIVLFAPTGSPLDPSQGLAGVARLVAGGGVRRFAIANPAHAPYGRAAEAALKAHGVWTALQPHLVLGENISQATQFATSGNAAGGIIALSLALSPNLQGRGRYALIPADLHPPLRQRMVLTSRAGPVAARFYDYMQTPAARAVLERYGFALPH
jgi:molybdate transport system substrate-binding protein